MRPLSLISLLCVAATTAECLVESPDHLLAPRDVAISKDGNCGLINDIPTTCLGSSEGNCCSYKGFCGNSTSYCGNGCQSDYGTCGDSNISTDGSCGGGPDGLSCIGFKDGSCCSAKGFCGRTMAHCGTGCQLEFGECGEDVTEKSQSTATGDSTETGHSAGTNHSSSNTTVPTDPQGAEQTQDNTTADGNDNKALKIGLGVGISVGVIAIGALVALLFLRRRRRQRPEEHVPVPLEKEKKVEVLHELPEHRKTGELVCPQSQPPAFELET
ncbi:hypothetical protein FQN54_001790 [Arachnomyces sp. PD_36]|nr:hypothetical protein FQN54_001790 [Arachnomyces sp. PD_36]